MFRTTLTVSLSLAVMQVIVYADDVSETPTEVKLRALTLKIPKHWRQDSARKPLRLATFQIPPTKGDKEQAELAVYNFPGGGGSVEANIGRWVGQFESKGRKQKITIGKAGDSRYYVVEVSGTYNKPVGPPIRRQTKPVEGSRMLAVILQLEQGVYFLKMTGEDETVKAQAKALRKSFGGSLEDEQEPKA